jgi:hypothetical protein
MNLKESFRADCLKRGMADAQIEAEWAVFAADYEKWLKDIEVEIVGNWPKAGTETGEPCSA